MHWAGPWQCPQSTAGLLWRSWAQDMAHSMEAAICLSPLPAEPCASATEHEDLPEYRKGGLRRNETHSFTLHRLFSFWGHRALLSLLLPLTEVMQGHHTALTRNMCLKADTMKLLKSKLSTFLALASNIAAALSPDSEAQAGTRLSQEDTSADSRRATCNKTGLKHSKKKSRQKRWRFVLNIPSSLHTAEG